MRAMKLTKTERWILSNQYRILEALYPQEQKDLAERREALESGYEAEYDSMSQHIYDDKDCLTEEQCREVIDILSMFRALHDAKDKGGVEEKETILEGFDGNDTLESSYMAYARYFCKSDGGRFEESRKGDFNSHSLMLGIYRRMLKEWKNSAKPHQLTKEDIVRIVGARTYREKN